MSSKATAAPTDEAAARTEIEQRDKHIATLRARAALAGFELMIVSAADGTRVFSAGRWGRTVDLPNAAAVSDWLDRVGVK
jgi:hypothetical protein